ncbi:unnamed protein product [Ambrosiozyma monospora]|uniref:Unnamed protein product n=1 Tax=Ambrosiozyma monospora TaxID=43982 RepID=A0A9W6T6C1_AMBMO|nr:unnamed protein product [Ambrosiozyma monospora]
MMVSRGGGIDVTNSEKRLYLSQLFSKVSLRVVAHQDEQKEKQKHAEHDSICLDSDDEFDLYDDFGAFDELKRNYHIANKQEKEVKQDKDGEQDGKLLTLNQLRDLYKNAESSSENKLVETYPSDFNLDLRPYQRHGLSWMLKREHEMGLIGANNNDVTDELRQELKIKCMPM